MPRPKNYVLLAEALRLLALLVERGEPVERQDLLAVNLTDSRLDRCLEALGLDEPDGLVTQLDDGAYCANKSVPWVRFSGIDSVLGLAFLCELSEWLPGLDSPTRARLAALKSRLERLHGLALQARAACPQVETLEAAAEQGSAVSFSYNSPHERPPIRHVVQPSVPRFAAGAWRFDGTVAGRRALTFRVDRIVGDVELVDQPAPSGPASPRRRADRQLVRLHCSDDDAVALDRFAPSVSTRNAGARVDLWLYPPVAVNYPIAVRGCLDPVEVVVVPEGADLGGAQAENARRMLDDYRAHFAGRR
jgi:hypothetical protein